MVLAKKGLHQEVIDRIRRYYTGGVTIPMVNDVPGKKIHNHRRTLRQGDCPSSTWFAYGVDPLLEYLHHRLEGITITSSIVHGPVYKGQGRRLDPIKQKYTVIGYCDDVKPAISNLGEFLIVDQGATLFEKSSGCRLHRDPTSDKCKVLLLGSWKALEQEEIPLPFLRITDSLDMLGVQLLAKYTDTRQCNGDILTNMIKGKTDLWKAGKFVPFCARSFSINCHALSKIWYRTSCVDVRKGDIKKMTSFIKGWIYQDKLVKPQEELLYRSVKDGGLGLFHLESKVLANLICCFLETAGHPDFHENFFHRSLLDFHVRGIGVKDPGRPPYYSQEFFAIIKEATEEGLNVFDFKVKDWYSRLVRNMTHETINMEQSLKVSRIEYLYPQVDHSQSHRCIRMSGLSSAQISTLFCLKNDLFPTRERLFRCEKASSERCLECCRRDDHGHFLMCSHLQVVCSPVIDTLREVHPGLSLERIVNVAFEGSEAEIFAACWVLSLLVEYIWESRRLLVRVFQEKMIGIFRAKLIILSKPKELKSKYVKTAELYELISSKVL